MALTEDRKPYEFLVRWDENGNLKGAHIAFLDLILKDGVIINRIPSTPECVAVGVGQEGFPLANILQELQISALHQVDSLRDQVSQLLTTGQNNLQTIESLTQQIYMLQTEIRELSPAEPESDPETNEIITTD